MLHQVQRAVVPHLPMEHTISRWNRIAEALASPWRQRRPQMGELIDKGMPGSRKNQQSGALE
jgi:hypothetical protein